MGNVVKPKLMSLYPWFHHSNTRVYELSETKRFVQFPDGVVRIEERDHYGVYFAEVTRGELEVLQTWM